MGVHPDPCSEPGQDGPRYGQTAFNLRALRGGSDASHAADWILQRTAKVFCITVQNTVQDRTQHNGRDRSWLRDQGLGMTRDVPPRSTVHNTYCEELTWCCCGVSCCDADAVANNGAAAVLLSRPQPIDSYWPSQHFRVGCACMLRGKSGRVRRMPNRVGRNQARVNRTDGADSTNSRWNRAEKPRVSCELCSVVFLGVAC